MAQGRMSEAAGGDSANQLDVVVVDWARDEGRKILTGVQYWYAVGFVKRLSEFGNEEATQDLRIGPFGKRFWSLKLKGGFLKKINLRIYFSHIADRREVVVLMAYKKEEDRRVSPSVYYTLEDRLEDYLAGRARVVARHRRSQSETEDQEGL